MKVNLLILIGSGLGGVARYWLSNLAYALLGKQFPIGTLMVNVTGSFLMGFLFVLILGKFGDFSQIGRPLLLIGFLGGYTTFSSFSIETINLIEAGNYSYGIANIVLSVMLCLGATWIGVLLGRQL